MRHVPVLQLWSTGIHIYTYIYTYSTYININIYVCIYVYIYIYDLGAPQLFFLAITCSNDACECMYESMHKWSVCINGDLSLLERTVVEQPRSPKRVPGNGLYTDTKQGKTF